MRSRGILSLGKALGVTLLLTALVTGILTTQLTAAAAVPATELAGVVTSPHGPEAGVWVIAEMTALPTRLVKIVVTTDQGRYVLPELPQATPATASRPT